MMDIFDRSIARSSWQEVAAKLLDPSLPFTLCHGDFHASNMMLLLKPRQAVPFGLRMFDVSSLR
jgi:aminoglycoside/choline kinase family phosphotransferase